MIVLKSSFLFAVFFGYLAKNVHSLTGCKFDGICQPYGSDWWIYQSEVCFRCPAGKKYHCARDYDSKESFREGCAEEKLCPQGEEPNLSYIKNGKQVTEPTVYCEPCHDKERYNSQHNTSSAEYSECPDTKWNKCTKDRHKILCKVDDLTDERYCRCDARNGFSPVNDFSYEKCSYKDYDCGDYKKCADKELLLNYTCASKCPHGFGRIDEDTDDCILLPTVETKTLTTLESTDSNKRTTLPSTLSPESTAKPIQGCVEECHEYKICVDGKCVCPNNCTPVKEPVCGHHAGSKSEYKTFPSICELKRSYCTDKKFIFHSNGECSKEEPKSLLIWIIIIVLVACIFLALFIFSKTKIGRQCRYRHSRHSEASSPSSGQLLTTVTVDGNQANGESLSEIPSDNNRPIIQNIHHYHSSVVQTKGGKQHISMPKGSDNLTVKYNKATKEDGEGDPLLSGHCDIVPVQEQRDWNKDSREHIPQPISANSSCKLRSDPILNPIVSCNDVEADSDVIKTKLLPVTENTQPKLSRAYRQRQNSMSYESLFLEPNITDIEEITSGSDECKDVINKVMDRSIEYLLENMDPKAVIDRFTAKEILTHKKRRDISDLVKQSEQTRDIIKSIRETGVHNYQDLKSCLAETKQFKCLEQLEQIQDEVIKELRIKQNPLQPVEEQGGSLLRATPIEGFTSNFVPPEEPLEEKAHKYLEDFSDVKRIYDGKKSDDTEKAYNFFENMCKEINEKHPKFKQTVVPEELPESLPVQEEYRNTPEGFHAYRASGKDNSCLYQSLSLLLTGTEDLQFSLRLLATLHAVLEFPTYKKQLQLLNLEKRKLFLYTMLGQNQDLDDSEDVGGDKCLKTLITETPVVGTDSSVLHVAFLSGALGMNIHQHFQHYGDNEAKLVETLKEVNIPDCFIKPGLPELHVFWVNMKNEENGPMNHFVPLLPKKETSEEKS